MLAVSKRKVIHGLQWVLRYKQENLPKKNLETLDKLAQLNEPLYMAYLHKESFYVRRQSNLVKFFFARQLKLASW
ncbi:MAG: transposase [Pseudobdellovibrionaceae bacterium]